MSSLSPTQHSALHTSFSLSALPAGKRLLWPHAIVCAVIFLAGIFLYSWNNTFSPYYHPAEPNRAAQILTDDYNFQHPLLLLRTTKLISHLAHAEDIYGVTLIGRWVIVLYSAASVVLVFIIAYLLAGNWAALTASLLTLLNDQLFNLAHYFKEDPCFAFGCLLVALAMIVYLRKPDQMNTIFLGIATGIACSGKYLGVMLLVPVVLWVILGRRQESQNPCSHLLTVFLTAIAVFLFINFPILTNFEEVKESISKAIQFALTADPSYSIPHTAYTAVFRETTDPLVWGLLFIYLAGLFLRRKSIPLEESFIIFIPVAFTITLSFSPKVNYSYFLPALLFLLVLTAAGLPTLLQLQWKYKNLIPSSAQLTIIGLILLAITGFQIPSIADLGIAFKEDYRQRLIKVLDLLPSSNIAEDRNVQLGNEYHWHQPSHAKHNFIGTLGDNNLNSYNELLAADVSYVILDRDNYEHFFKKSISKEALDNPEFQKMREMYNRILKRGKLLWESNRGKIPYLQPPLKLIQIQEK